jgi:hypothetical protein
VLGLVLGLVLALALELALALGLAPPAGWARPVTSAIALFLVSAMNRSPAGSTVTA